MLQYTGVKKIGAILVGVVLLLSTPGWAEDNQGKTVSPVELYSRLQREIQSLHLLMTLSLRKEQKEFILSRAKMARVMEELYKFRARELLLPLNVSLANLKRIITHDENVSMELRVNLEKMRDEFETVNTNYEKKRLALAEEIKQQLDGRQLYLLDNYAPSFIPAQRSIKVEKEEDLSLAEEILVIIRGMSEKKYEKNKVKFALRLLKCTVPRLPPDYIVDEEKERQRILLFFAEARKMNESDFNTHKRELLEAFKSAYVIPKLSVNLAGKIEYFLLSSEIIPFLKNQQE